jgi:hypothetical protein
MQTRFAIYDMHHAAAMLSVRVFVGYFNGKWAAMRLTDRDAFTLSTTLPGELEQRTANIRHGVGTVGNLEKPLIEIGMLLKRYTVLLRTSIGDQNDWAVKKITKLKFNELFRLNDRAVEFALQALMLRLFDRDGLRQNRIVALLNNAKALRYLETGTLQTSSNSSYFSGLLASAPGAWWKGTWYNYTGAGQHLLDKMMLCKKIGASLAMVSALYDSDESHYTALADLNAFLTQRTTPIALGGATCGKIDVILQDIDGAARTCDCGHFEMPGHEHTVVDGGSSVFWCHHCWEHESVMVVDVGEHWPRDNAVYSEVHNAYYSYDIDAEEGGAETEYEEDSGRAILDYSTNVTRVLNADPAIRSSPYGEFLMGVELEITTGGTNRSTAAKEIRKKLGVKYCVIKNDGSLPDDGIEIVTAPRGLAEHIAAFSKWEVDSRYRAWDSGSCGMHVHIHSRAFTEMTLGKFLMFINMDDNASFIRKLAGRHPLQDHQASRYCAQEGMEILENPKAAVKGKSRERYRMVNTQNLTKGEAERLGLDPYSYGGKYDTIELRIFKASLKKARLLAQIEFAHAVVMFCRVASYRDLTGKSFLQWLQPNVASYPNLADWYGARRSKALLDAKVASLEAVCPDKVTGDVSVPQRILRATRPRAPLRNINQYLTPRARREAQEAQLREAIRREQERLRQATEARNAALTSAPTGNTPF